MKREDKICVSETRYDDVRIQVSVLSLEAAVVRAAGTVSVPAARQSAWIFGSSKQLYNLEIDRCLDLTATQHPMACLNQLQFDVPPRIPVDAGRPVSSSGRKKA